MDMLKLCGVGVIHEQRLMLCKTKVATREDPKIFDLELPGFVHVQENSLDDKLNSLGINIDQLSQD